MCGILGAFLGEGSRLPASAWQSMLERLFVLSESRGKEAAGVAVADEAAIRVVRMPVPASEMLESPQYRDTLAGALERRNGNGSAGPLAAIGHARLVTNGLQGIDANNQPVLKNDVVCVHNGIIVNEAALWNANPTLQRASDVDTEVLAAMLDRDLAAGGSIEAAARSAFGKIFGEASIAALFASSNGALLATNTGSLFVAYNAELGVSFFASEMVIARRLLEALEADVRKGFGPVRQVKANAGVVVDLQSAAPGDAFDLSAPASPPGAPARKAPAAREVVTSTELTRRRLRELRRCTRCVLPETMPFIEFDASGVCNYCRNHQSHRIKGRAALEEVLDRFRSKDGSPDCLIGFSGGRDSSYALHLLRKEFGMTPIAYTYDWGMVTDLARRNQARLCGRLGVEHIWISADIKRKRQNIRRNVEAWLRRPDLGMVPLFMAGDKQFMYHASRLMREMNIRLMIYATNSYERTDFKVGFCGVRPASAGLQLHGLSVLQKAQLVFYYVRRFAANPRYLNRSLADTFGAFLSYYVQPQDFFYLFDYLEWNEDEINRLLRAEYDWELARDTSTTWRIGDGTAPFYNYIYQTVAGFSEYETFRSNQIREGAMTRVRALELIEVENVARYESIQEYCRLINTDFDDAMRAIDMIPKRY